MSFVEVMADAAYLAARGTRSPGKWSQTKELQFRDTHNEVNDRRVSILKSSSDITTLTM